MRSDKSDLRPRLSRSRTGCLPCRRRRKKCDEGKPHCTACIRNKLSCIWPRDSHSRTQEKDESEVVLSSRDQAAMSTQFKCPSVSPFMPPETQEQGTIVLLAPLTTIHLGRLAIKHVSAIATLSNFMLSPDNEQSSYIFHIPQRLGHDITLDDAARCVIAAFREIRDSHSSPDSKGSASLSLYTRALRSLQHALDDPTRSRSAETLCAAELLCIFEYLKRDSNHAWIHHARGASRLVQHRGPQSFTTDFEKALFMSQVGIIVTESFFTNTACFLDQADWMSTLRAVISPHQQYADRSEMMISLYENMIPLAGVMADCSAFIMKPNMDDKMRYNSLLQGIHIARNGLLAWKDRWKDEFTLLEDFQKRPSQDVNLPKGSTGRRFEILLTHQANILLCNRLCVAFDQTGEFMLERQSQDLATTMVRLRDEWPLSIRQSNVTLSLTCAHAVLKTAEDWDSSRTTSKVTANGSQTLIEPEKFRHWLELMGVQVTNKTSI